MADYRICPKCGKFMCLYPDTTSLQTCTCPPDPTPPKQYAEGWVCPKCGRVSAPWVSICPCWQGHIHIFYGSSTTTTASVGDWQASMTEGAKE